ncbi:MAG: zinc ABC transporter substrate-binding protein [Dehalococcoidia bacterium]|nr:MAG: zinc ABC transporter substrate-binding protein [Dehalococcoidia bacterium]
MKTGALVLSVSLLIAALAGSAACNSPVTTSGKKAIVVTYSILGSIVKELVGDAASVSVSIPNGLDPHEWEPSAKDIEKLNRADLIVQNGLGLEGGMEKALAQAKANGVRLFTASDYITVRHVGPGEGIPSGDPDQAIGAPDPHLWTDPLAMKNIVAALAEYLKANLDINVDARSLDIQTQLDLLNTQVAAEVAALPQDSRKLVTGHESMGYFAQRYGFKLVGALVPSLSSQANVSAGDLAALKQLILDNNVKVIFAEVGTSGAVASAIASETGARVVELSTHILPSDGSYFTFETQLAETIVNALK